MTLREQYDAAMLAFSRGDFASAIEQLKPVVARHPSHFDARLALGMAYYRRGDFAAAIAEGLKAEKLRPRELFVHTNLSLFYLKAGDKISAEHHSLQARIAGWRAGNAAAQSKGSGTPAETDAELQMARPKSPRVKVIRMPDKYPDPPRKEQG